MTTAHDDLDSLDLALETALAGITFAANTYDSDATSLSLLDRLEALQHLGVRLDYPDTDDPGLSPGDAYQGQWVHDTVTVTLSYQLRTKGQRESRRCAMALARQIRLVITGAVPGNRPTFIRTRRSIPRTGWLRIVQTYRVRRDQAVR